MDDQSNLLFASRHFYEFFGIDEINAPDKSILSLVPPAVAEALLGIHLRVLETGISEDHIQRIKWADGSDYVFHIDIFPIEGISGRKILGGHAVNLTEKFNAEKRLRETNDRLLLFYPAPRVMQSGNGICKPVGRFPAMRPSWFDRISYRYTPRTFLVAQAHSSGRPEPGGGCRKTKH